jgi:hypothetical protein
MSIAHAGQCTPGSPCGGPSNIQCAAGQSCNIPLTSPSDCNTPNLSGQCYVTPTMCPLVIGAQTSTACDMGVICTSVCDAIEHGVPWYPDATCPL